MAITDPIADCITRIRNAQSAHLSTVKIKKSKMNVQITEILKSEGYIQSYTPSTENFGTLELELKYTASRMPVIREIKRISTPGCRRYASVEDLKNSGKTLDTIILSTPKGVMTDRNAKKENVGGELLCRVS